MINMYAYTYPSAKREFLLDGYILVKVGDSPRAAEVRMAEHGGAAEWESKITIGQWPNLKQIYRDYAVHDVLKRRGLWHKDGAGTEWFKIPAANEAEAFAYLDQVITSLEGRKARQTLKLRRAQQRALDRAMEFIRAGETDVSIIANLAPRFGKTLWALALFNEISSEYGNRVMLLPAYWLSVHTSFVDELDEFADFVDIALVDPNSASAELDAQEALADGRRILVPISLHGDLASWCAKHQWVSQLSNNDIFMFADEGDFGTHAENQVEKLDFLFQ